MTDFAVDIDRAAVLLRDDVPADRQAEPGALAGRLGRKERLKQFVADPWSSSTNSAGISRRISTRQQTREKHRR